MSCLSEDTLILSVLFGLTVLEIFNAFCVPQKCLYFVKNKLLYFNAISRLRFILISVILKVLGHKQPFYTKINFAVGSDIRHGLFGPIEHVTHCTLYDTASLTRLNYILQRARSGN
jgi:hypothetical protein